jgi:hypothetical protein
MRRRDALAALGAAAAAAVLAAAPDASAFCRTTTAAIDPLFVSTPEQPCWTEGLPLYWKSACVGYSIQQSASKQVSFDDAQLGMETAFAQWTNATCPTSGATSSKASIDVRFLGPVACHEVQYNQSGGNANIIMFDDDGWPHDDSNNTLGLTTVTYNIKTGELYDADMEINTAQVSLTVNGDVPPNGYDFLSIVTHESGHFLGLAHSPDSHATMYAHYTEGATSMRNLSTDDIAGICTIYPPDGTRAAADGPVPEGACDPTPRHGYASTCGGSSGCSAAPGAPRDGEAALALSVAALAAALGSRGRARRA